MRLKLASSVEVLKTLSNTSRHGLLTLTNPDCITLAAFIVLTNSKLTSWVKVLLVWLVLSVWVANLLHDVILLVQDIVTDTSEVSVLEISVKIDLHDTIADGIDELLLRRSRSTVEDQEDWRVLLGSNGILNVLLVLAEELWVELDISWFVDTMDVSKTGSDGEVWGDWRKSLVDGKDILWLSVKGVVVNILVVDTILLTTSDTDLLLFN
jgi:hypothetical protein